MMVALAGLEGNNIEMAMASPPSFYDALTAFDPDGAEDNDLAQLSDRELASVIGGDAGNPLQTLRVSVPEALRGILNQNFTYVLTGPSDNSSASSTNETTNGRNVQTNNSQQSTTPSSQQSTNGPVQSLQQVVHVTVTPQSNGTTRVVVQQGVHTSTTLLPFHISPEALFNSIPFQALVSLGHNLIQNIHQLSAPMLGNPSSLLRMH
jgi:hypothetical protein